MTSQNNPLLSERGSALIVTLLLVGVLLATALIVLQKIVPYAKSVRSMHDASQAYYVARGQADLARLNFLYGSGGTLAWRMPSLFGLLSTETGSNSDLAPAKNRGNVSGSTYSPTSGTASDKQLYTESDTKIVNVPFRDNKNYDFVAVSANKNLPLTIQLSPNDNAVKKLGTSKLYPDYHTLNPYNSGGLRFDLRGVDTQNTVNPFFTLTMKFESSAPASKKITLKMQYEKTVNATTTTTATFTQDFDLSNNDTLIFTPTSPGQGNVQIIDSSGVITPGTMTFAEFLNSYNCKEADVCSLVFTVNGTTPVDFKLVSSVQVPDLNAVAIGDGRSDNGLYYQRIIDYIPTPQDI